MAIGTADIFTADYSSRNGNWDGVTANSNEQTVARVASGGPNGLDALEVTFFAVTAGAEPGEEYLGGSETMSNPGLGVARYYRYYEWQNASNDFVAMDSTGSDSVVWRLKRLILGDGGGGDRVIINTNAEAGAAHLEGIIDGTASVGSTGNVTLGSWYAVQIEVIYNDPSASTVKLWLNSDTYASPTFTVTEVAVVPSNYGTAGYGRYSNHRLRTSGNQFIFREAAFRVASTFDSNWYGWMQNGDGIASPTNLRVAG